MIYILTFLKFYNEKNNNNYNLKEMKVLIESSKFMEVNFRPGFKLAFLVRMIAKKWYKTNRLNAFIYNGQ